MCIGLSEFVLRNCVHLLHNLVFITIFVIVTCEVTRHRHLDAQISRRMLAPYTEHLGIILQ